MYSSLLRYSTFGALFYLICLPRSFAIHQHHGLPHEVLNITSLEEALSPTDVTEALTCSFTTTTEFVTSTEACPTPTATREIHSLIFPSPDASPIEITAQSQVITSFLPQITWCMASPKAELQTSAAPYANASASYTGVANSTGSCETVYAPLETTVCATTLTGLASKVTITDCDQEVTFSSEAGFTLETPSPTTLNNSLITPAPTVKRLNTYWLAPWQSFTAGQAPSDVDVKVCTVQDDGGQECMRSQEIWEVVVVTRTLTTSTTLEFVATVSGPGTLIVQTMQSIITNTIQTIDLSTTLLLETEIETESTSTGKKSSTASSSTAKSSTDIDSTVEKPTSTLYITKTLLHAPTSVPVSNSSSVEENEPTSTIRVTSTVTHTSTRTIKRPRPT